MAAVACIDLRRQGHTAFVEVTDGSTEGDICQHCPTSLLNTYQQLHNDGFDSPSYHSTLYGPVLCTLTCQCKDRAVARPKCRTAVAYGKSYMQLLSTTQDRGRPIREQEFRNSYETARAYQRDIAASGGLWMAPLFLARSTSDVTHARMQ